MYFQTIDNKNGCQKLFLEDQSIIDVHFSNDEEYRTWSYEPFQNPHRNIEYAKFYVGGKTINTVARESGLLNAEWIKVSTDIKNHLKACKTAKIDLKSNCFFDVIPEHSLNEYFDVKNKLTQYVFENYERPKNYEQLCELTRIFDDLSRQKVKVSQDYSSLDLNRKEVATALTKIKVARNFIDYELFGTVTGRLTTKPHSFPILYLQKDVRGLIQPNNDYLIEFDYNAADVRSLLYLAKEEQPEFDIHEWNKANFFPEISERDELKRKFFAWLYGQEHNPQLEKVYKKDALATTYYVEGSITNPFGRKIECDKEHALPYLIQSTTTDIIFKHIIEIAKLLKDKKTKLYFTIHDNVVLDVAKEEKYLLKQVKDIMQREKFVVSSKIGLMYGRMKEVTI